MAGSILIRGILDSAGNVVGGYNFDKNRTYTFKLAVDGGGFLNIGGLANIQTFVAIIPTQAINDVAIVKATGSTSYMGYSDLQLTMPNYDASGYLVAWQANGIQSNWQATTIGNAAPPPLAMPEYQGNLFDQINDAIKTITESAGKTIDTGINSTRMMTQAITYGLIAVIAIVVIALFFYALQPRKQQEAAGAAKIILDTKAAQQLVDAGKLAATKGAA